jgi:DNA-binding NtrC family response regulator
LSSPLILLRDVERSHILAAFDRAGGNRKVTAAMLGVTPSFLKTRLERYGIPRDPRGKKTPLRVNDEL